MKITRRLLIRRVASCAALAVIGARAQQTNRLPRVALVFSAIPVAEIGGADPIDPFARAFVHALRDLGLVDGRNIVIVRRSAEGRTERFPALMEELVAIGVDVIVTFSPKAVRAAQRVTDRIAIIALVDNVLDTGLIDSLARPGRNVTGIGDSYPGTYAKELQFLREAAPGISRVAVIDNRPLPGPRTSSHSEIYAAARSMQMDVLWVTVDAPEEFEAAFATIVRERADALDAIGNPVTSAHRRRIADFALKQRLPSIGFPEDGMLLQYGPEPGEIMRRAAVQVKKILDGTKPGDLPFEQPTKLVLTINLKTAKALGLTIPQSLLQRADEVIQ